MPIFDYECQKCGERFEELVRRPQDKVRCPKCGSEEVERKISAPAIHGSSGTASSCASSRFT